MCGTAHVECSNCSELAYDTDNTDEFECDGCGTTMEIRTDEATGERVLYILNSSSDDDV